MSVPEQPAADLWATAVSESYPTTLVRDRLERDGVLTAAALRKFRTVPGSPLVAWSRTDGARPLPAVSRSSLWRMRPGC